MKTEKSEPDSQNPKAPMPGLSYPFTYVCLQCSEEVTVARSDVEDIQKDPDTSGARQFVLRQRGWRIDDTDGLLCPDCTEK